MMGRLLGDHTPKSYDLRPFCGWMKRRRSMLVPSLPEEIIFNILLCLPADILYYVMRLVCREWFKIIMDPKFIDAHLFQSPTGILIQTRSRTYSTQYVEIGENGLQSTDLNLSQLYGRDGRGRIDCFQPQQHIQPCVHFSCKYVNYALKFDDNFPGSILATCNGLVTFADRNSSKVIHVANLITKQWIALPPAKDSFVHPGFACGPSSRAYKLVYQDADVFRVLTIGVDKEWRCLGIPERFSYILENTKAMHHLKPFSVGGFVHWNCLSFILSFDVERESFRLSHLPEGYENRTKQFLATGSFLSFMASCNDNKYAWELWGLTNLETGVWAKLHMIDLAGQKPNIRRKLSMPRRQFDLHPVGCFQSGELVLFEVKFRKGASRSANFINYNVKTGAINPLQLTQAYCISKCYFPHMKSLVSLKAI